MKATDVLKLVIGIILLFVIFVALIMKGYLPHTLLPTAAEAFDFCKEAKKQGLVCIESDTEKVKARFKDPPPVLKVETKEEWLHRVLTDYYRAIPDQCEWGKDCPDDWKPKQ